MDDPRKNKYVSSRDAGTKAANLPGIESDKRNPCSWFLFLTTAALESPSTCAKATADMSGEVGEKRMFFGFFLPKLPPCSVPSSIARRATGVAVVKFNSSGEPGLNQKLGAPISDLT